MSWTWLALVSERPSDADADAQAWHLDGAAAGVFAAWKDRVKPRREARRIDARVIDAAGPAATVSLVLPPPGVQLLFDDPAVQHARRQVLARAPFDALTTLLRGASHFEGALTVARGPDAFRLMDDPFARIFPARVLRVEAGLFGRTGWPVGPVIERYGSDQPWPSDRFQDAITPTERSARLSPRAVVTACGQTHPRKRPC